MTKSSTLNFYDLIKDHNDSCATFTSSENKSWHDLAARLVSRRLWLQKEGIAAGDRVAIYAPPDSRYIETLLAMWSLGIIAVPMNTRLPKLQIEEMLRSINCRHVISPTHFSNSLRTIPFQSMHSGDIVNHSRDIEFNLKSPATIIFTSGSTGVGKACLHSFGNHSYSALGSNDNIQLGAGDSWLLSLPLYHVAGIAIVFRCLLSGAAIALPDAEQSLTQNLDQLAPTHLSLVATQLHQLLSNKNTTPLLLKKTKAILLGGSAIPTPLIKEAAHLELPIFTSYGSTEMSSQITTTKPGDSINKLKTSGRVLKYRDIKISDDGEILVHGRTLFAGYVSGENINPATDGDGRHHTRDSGTIDSGYLKIIGRMDNMFISGGENIFPEEIEKAIEQLEGVEQALVVPVDDLKFGKRPVVFIRLKKPCSIDDINVQKLDTLLPGYKLPDHLFEWLDSDDTKKPNRISYQQRAEKLLRRRV